MNSNTPHWFLLWIPVLTYLVLVEIILAIFAPSLILDPVLFRTRIVFLLVFVLLYVISKKIPDRISLTINIIAVYALMSLLYKETAQINTHTFAMLDPVLIRIDQAIFGFQPSLIFPEKFGQIFFSELMYFGYFFYYIMPLMIILIVVKRRPEKLASLGFVLISSFLIYYLIFILFPAVGPQFYFPYPDNRIEAQGFFGKLVKWIQLQGEVPTAAFPSSHVGISTILLIWIYKNIREYLIYFMPFTIILLFSTIYIKAHYFIDVPAGLVSAPLVYIFSSGIYHFLKSQSWKSQSGL